MQKILTVLIRKVGLTIEKKNDCRNSFLPHDQEYNEILKNHFENPKVMSLIGKLTFTDED